MHPEGKPRWGGGWRGRSLWRTGEGNSTKLASPETLDFRASHYSRKSTQTDSSCETYPSRDQSKVTEREPAASVWRTLVTGLLYLHSELLQGTIPYYRHWNETLSFQSSSAGGRPDGIRFSQSRALAWDLNLEPSQVGSAARHGVFTWLALVMAEAAGSAVGGGSTAFPSEHTVIPRASIGPGSSNHHLLAQCFKVSTGHWIPDDSPAAVSAN